jgi:hypothetical protein
MLELAITLAGVHRALRQWTRYAHRLEGSLDTITDERNALLAELKKRDLALHKARSTIHSAVTRRVFDEVYQRAMESK